MASKLSTIGIPKGASAKVSIINNSFLWDIPVDNYIQPKVPGYDKFYLPSYAFLIENTQGRKVLFDFGLRKDWENLTPEAAHEISGDGIEIEVERDVVDILADGGVKGEDIEAVVFSHHHWDHIGDMSKLPASTDIIVGPGFSKAFLPGYPANPDSPILQSDYENHKLQEINFSGPGAAITVAIGAFSGYDFFGDGSLYLVDAPGHSIGHICALVRTTSGEDEDTYVFLGADACHHNGEFRPSPWHPLPAEILPNPLTGSSVYACPGASWERHLKAAGRSKEMAFFDIPDTTAGAAYTHDVQASRDTISRVQDVDSGENVLVILAHDNSVKDIVDFFPKPLNGWKAKGWGVVSRWAFLKDFQKVYSDDYV
ncbi:Metallo-hydrolase/oxidoreductase [Thozetella sp. PMI_491]|nr:Metallo-hydrolase/oxidoreductase [Thozetella sp. PMI_491]